MDFKLKSIGRPSRNRNCFIGSRRYTF